MELRQLLAFLSVAEDSLRADTVLLTSAGMAVLDPAKGAVEAASNAERAAKPAVGASTVE